ncbi:hypothetical protein BDY21DRAFT_278913 [Lineolata rhizophorae]|uniref:Glycerophosphocholine acyltransferase 1 n=1 Tax=Lineolata rhizophorae TaxID=578093 RepID=A0A6A6PD48_9PEZI|nr:hypothetical protein BDY21DRAFT_278913 [Lineolata rhizophorae]
MIAVAFPKRPAGPRPFHRRTPSSLSSVPEDLPVMTSAQDEMALTPLASSDSSAAVSSVAQKSKSQPELSTDSGLSAQVLPGDMTHGVAALQTDRTSQATSPGSKSSGLGIATPSSFSQTPRALSRRTSLSSSSQDEDDGYVPPIDRLTVFDFLENLALPSRLEKLQTSLQAQGEKVRRHQERLRSRGINAKDRVVDEWRRRIPTPADDQLDKYKKRMRDGVDRLGKQWDDSKAVTIREKISFISGVLNVFVSGYLIGAFPQYFHYWYTAQLCYFMPIRYYKYHKIGYHYFLADLCYYTNFLLILSIWVFPNSKRLFISTYCLAFGNNAVAIAMWRNSLVFHSLDKVTSLFIHIMPCVTLHCLVHLIPPSLQLQRFPAIHTIAYSEPSSPQHYTLSEMIIYATIPYAIWQLSYHFFITVRRREKIAAGRPTSFTWLRKSYAPTWIGRLVLSLPEQLQEAAFMLIQYVYALLTMVPCPLWFWSRWASAAFLATVFTWSVYNGATYYIEYYGKRFQRELEALKQDVAKWQSSPDAGPSNSSQRGGEEAEKDEGKMEKKPDNVQPMSAPAKAADEKKVGNECEDEKRRSSIEQIPLLDEKSDGTIGSGGKSTGVEVN